MAVGKLIDLAFLNTEPIYLGNIMFVCSILQLHFDVLVILPVLFIN